MTPEQKRLVRAKVKYDKARKASEEAQRLLWHASKEYDEAHQAAIEALKSKPMRAVKTSEGAK